MTLDKEVPEVLRDEKFQFRDIFQKSVLHPFLVILVLMFLLQFSGQGAITFFTVQIFSVSFSHRVLHCPLNLGPRVDHSVLARCFVMFDVQDAGAGSLISARDCALTIGITYFLSALLSLVMKNLLGRRLLMLVSLLGTWRTF